MIHKVILGIHSFDLRETLAAHRDEIDASDADGRTPMIWASFRGDIIAVEELIKAKANPNLCSVSGMTALMAASSSGNINCIKSLLAAGADPSVLSFGGRNALHFAAYSQGQEENIRTLFQAGTDIDARDARGISPLSYATQRHHAVAAATLLDCGADIDSLDREGDSALHESLHYSSDDVTQLLLSRGATYTLWDSNGDSVLHLAAKSGGNRTIEIMISAGLRNIDPDALNRGGKSALQVAQDRNGAEEGFADKMHELLEGIRARNGTLEHSVSTDLDSQDNISWLQSTRSFFNPARTRRPRNQNEPHTKPRTSVQTCIFLGLCLTICFLIYRNLDPGRITSLLRLIWEMVDPGDLKGL